MANEYKITIENYDKVLAWLQAKPAQAASAISRAMKESAYTVEREAKISLTTGPNRALDTGRLRASTAVQSLGALRATIYPTVNYAIYVHEGTRYMRSRPFMGEAADRSLGMINEIFNDAIAKAIA